MRECDHFAKDCSNMKAADNSNSQAQQIKWLMDTEENMTLKLFTGETYISLCKAGSENIIQQLSLKGGRMKAPDVCQCNNKEQVCQISLFEIGYSHLQFPPQLGFPNCTLLTFFSFCCFVYSLPSVALSNLTSPNIPSLDIVSPQ